MITIRSLRKYLGGRHVLNDISLQIPTGATLALIGPSGTGKSVLLKHVIGLMEPDSGEISLDEHSLTAASYEELGVLRRRMGYVFQDAALLDSLTVSDNLKLALSDADQKDAATTDQRVQDALLAVNLDGTVLQKLPRELSGGTRKRVGIARAIINRPRFMLYDEPTTGLDPQNVDVINDLIVSTKRDLNATSIVITHDIASVRRMADRVALLAHGSIRFEGTPAELEACDDTFVQDFLNIRAEAA